MKTTKILIFLLTLLIFSCKKEEATPTETCKVSVIDRGNGNKHAYTYDANGRVAIMTREFDGSGAGDISKYVYSFTFDNAGMLAKSVWTLNGKADGSEIYTYTNGKISKVNYTYADGSKGINNIKYDVAGNIIEFTYETGDPNSDAIQYFAYDTNNIQIKHGYKGFDGTIFFEVQTKPTGITKSSEQLLTKYGLPYDVLTGFSWASAQGDVGTIFETFVLDNNDKLVSDGKEKLTSVKIDSKGYISESTSTDDNGSNVTSKFILQDCN